MSATATTELSPRMQLILESATRVVAAGGIIGGGALTVAVIVKLARVLLLAPVVATLSVRQRRLSRMAGESGQQRSSSKLPPIVPLFIIGFIAMVLLRSFVPLPSVVLTTGGLPDPRAGGETVRQVAGGFLIGFAETFSQYIMEVQPGGGSDRPETEAGVERDASGGPHRARSAQGREAVVDRDAEPRQCQARILANGHPCGAGMVLRTGEAQRARQIVGPDVQVVADARAVVQAVTTPGDAHPTEIVLRPR